MTGNSAVVRIGGALGSGLVLALVTSGGLVGERISEGAPWVAAAVNALVTVVSVLVLAITLQHLGARMGAAARMAQVGGAMVGVALVHVLVRERVFFDVPWLSERPTQLVNDATAAGATLVLIWACARELDVRVFGVALALVTLYRVTAFRWHLDQAPHGFQNTVQQLVVMQFAAVALGLLIFTQVRRSLS